MANDSMKERGDALENEYFYRKEQELIAKMKAKLATEESKPTEKLCPNKCDGTFKVTNFENIEIDVCEKCGGVWLDAGELAQITQKEEEKSGWFGRLLG